MLSCQPSRVNSIANSALLDVPKNLIEVLTTRADEQANQQAFQFLQGSKFDAADGLTYGQLHHRACCIASTLQAMKLQGQRALLLYPPGLDFIAAFCGCLYAGVTAVPAYPPRRNQTLTRLQSVVADAQAALVLTTAALEQRFNETASESTLGLSQLIWLATDRLADESSWQMPELHQDTPAFLQYTSGSTGNPKGVTISHGNLMHNLAAIYRCFEHSPASQGFIWLPPYHDMGLIGGILQPLYGGFPVTLMAPVDFLQKPIRWLQAISHYRATTSGGPNFAYELCLKKVKPEQLGTLDLSTWEVAFTGAEPIQPETLKQFADRFAPCGFAYEAFYPCYGMAESTLIIAGGSKQQAPIIRTFATAALEQNQGIQSPTDAVETRSLVSSGVALADSQVLIVQPDPLTVLPEGAIGEIWVSSDSVAQGYWHQPELTAQTFHARLPGCDSKRYLRTGDLGFLSDQELFVTGRCKDVIIIRGQNHYPQDIELTVEHSHAALRSHSGAAFSIEYKNAERLIIVHELKRTYLRSANTVEIVSSMRQAITRAHGLDPFVIALIKTGSLPKTSSGKIRRHTCRHSFLNGDLNIVDDWSKDPSNKTSFLHLQSEIDSVLAQLQSGGD